MINRRKQHTEQELIVLFKQKNIDEIYFDKFIAYYNVCYSELNESYKDYQEEDWDDEDDTVQAAALRVTNLFIEPYLELLSKGHSEEWAYELAHYGEFDEDAVFHVHSSVQRIDRDLAERDLLIHAKSLGGDEYFVKHYLFLCEMDEDPRTRIATASEYSKIYKEQLQKGKSAIYAHEYADLVADKHYLPIYCENYALAYDKALNENKSIRYANIYADKYASALEYIETRHGIPEDEESVEFAIEKVNAYMNAWQYAQEHKIKDFNRFADIFENRHLNTLFADERRPKGSREEIDKIILEKVLGSLK